MITLGVILLLLCLLFLIVLVWRAFESERKKKEQELVNKVFPDKNEEK